MMNIEENRLQTFRNWPSNSAVTPERIAKAGFFFIYDGLSVECFSCRLRISEWNYGDQVMAKHKTLSPTCLFVLDPSTSGNVPIGIPSRSSNGPSSSTTYLDYTDEIVRLSTFQNWPAHNIVTPESLARAGFYYINKSDNTRCAFCNGLVSSWVIGDDPDKEHKRHFPNCPFVISTINDRLSRDHSLSNSELVDKGELGINAHIAPKRPNCATVESRLRTFTNWPADLLQTSDVLAQAGFYYEGTGDQVRCFHCDGGLRHWDPEDDPWTEHARWFPLCSFVKLVKGQDFIQTCSVGRHTSSNWGKVTSTPPQPLESQETTPRRWVVTERELEQHMTDEIVLTALSIGLNAERVKRALREKIEQTGRMFSRADALVEATLHLQLEEEEDGVGSGDYETECQCDRDTSRAFSRFLNDPNYQTAEAEVSTTPTPSAPPRSPPRIADQLQPASKSVSLEEENRLLKEARLCKICMDGEVGVVFLPCGHFATCVNCAPNLKDCPVCRSAIKATVRTFLA